MTKQDLLDHPGGQRISGLGFANAAQGLGSGGKGLMVETCQALLPVEADKC